MVIVRISIRLSALPYYFYRGLRDNAVEVTPISLIPARRTQAIDLCASCGRLVNRLIHPFRRVRGHDVLRSRLYYVLAERQLRFMARQHADADLNVFRTFSYSSTPACASPRRPLLRSNIRARLRGDRTRADAERPSMHSDRSTKHRKCTSGADDWSKPPGFHQEALQAEEGVLPQNGRQD